MNLLIVVSRVNYLAAAMQLAVRPGGQHFSSHIGAQLQRVPCRSCPWRVSTKTEDIPGGGMDHIRARNIGHGGATLIAMGCHLGTDEEPIACAGYVVQVGLSGSPGLRLLQLRGVLDPDDYSDGGARLHPTMEAMLRAHPDPNLLGESDSEEDL